jgi:hypothetical protein
MAVVVKHVYGGETTRVVACRRCRTHLCEPETTISRDFQGQHGRAHLYADATNVLHGAPQSRAMTTGTHVVSDLYCIECRTRVGWRYLHASEPAQRYKVGHCVLERALVIDMDHPSAVI